MINVLMVTLAIFLLGVLVIAVALISRKHGVDGKIAGMVSWDDLNRLYYEKFPNLRQIECANCKQQYRDFDRCPQCRYSRWAQLGVKPPAPQPSDKR